MISPSTLWRAYWRAYGAAIDTEGCAVAVLRRKGAVKAPFYGAAYTARHNAPQPEGFCGAPYGASCGAGYGATAQGLR
jgi:hypothetical protein